MENIQLYNMEEVWKDIKGYGDKYEVSSLGRVRNGSYILTNQIDKYGYVYVALTEKGKSKKFKVHRLVGEYFVPNPHNLPCINHKSEVKSDNTPSNLEWMTVAENNRFSKGVKVLMFHNDSLYTFDSASQASEELGLTLDSVYTKTRNTTYLLGCLNYLLTEGKSLPKVSLSDNIDKGINLKDGWYTIRVTHGGKRNYVGKTKTLDEARVMKQEYINKYCPITTYPTDKPDINSIKELLLTLK